jgi:hypothetical protein
MNFSSENEGLQAQNQSEVFFSLHEALPLRGIFSHHLHFVLSSIQPEMVNEVTAAAESTPVLPTPTPPTPPLPVPPPYEDPNEGSEQGKKVKALYTYMPQNGDGCVWW